jgi:quinol monooxygenase YgiN
MANVVLYVRFHTKPGKKEAFRAHLYRTIEAMQVEPAFVNTIVHDVLDAPDDIVLYEIWRGSRERWLGEELNRPYRAEYEAGLPALIEQRIVEWLQPAREWGSLLLEFP